MSRQGSRDEVEFVRSKEVRPKGSRERWNWREAMIDVHVKVATVSGLSEDECLDIVRLKNAQILCRVQCHCKHQAETRQAIRRTEET
jgi:hypothetical protein